MSRTSWLSVWKARFLRTLVLMDRTWERVGEGKRAQAERKQRRELVTHNRGQCLRDKAKMQCYVFLYRR